MDRSGFRNRMKQYKKAREENPGLKYWEWKNIPKYDEGGEVGTPSIGMVDFNTKLVNLLSEIYTKGLSNTVKRRLYDNLIPYNYGNDVQGVTGRIINSVWKNKQDVLPSDEYNYDTMRDDIFAEYLGIPSNRRHDITDIMGNDVNDKKHLVIPSKYKPAKQTDSNVEYKTINKIKDQDILKATNFNYDADEFPINPLEFNESRTVHGGGLEYYFGNYTVSRGVDPVKGEYRSFYDLWDLNPFYGKHSSKPDNTVEKILNKISGNKDASLGIGKPIEFYDRVYLDDYYNINSSPKEGDYYGGYLPEITVMPNKYAEGTDQVEPDPLDVLEASRPKVAGIPINDKPLSGTDPIGEAMMWGLGGGAASAALRSLFPTYGATAAWLAFGGDNKDNMLVIPNNPTKNTTPIKTGLLNKEVRQYYTDDVLPRDVLTSETDKLKFLNTDKNFEYDLYPQGYFANGVVGHYDRMNDVIRLNGGYVTDKDLLDNVMSHEVNHRYNREFPLDKEHTRILNRAYTVEPKLNTAAARAARKESEKRATNVNIRHKLQTDLRNTLGRKPTKTEMDKFIDSLPD